ncbi:MAG: hypothetical protein HY055_00340 [Magnetospirillum sp.]|nr:hypothetical protein [Magnetospirillum sp.]
MPIRVPFPLLDAEERRHDGPVLCADPAALPSGGARESLFRHLAAEQRRDIAHRRLGLAAVQALGDEGLRRDQRRLRFYRDLGAEWKRAASTQC